MAPTAQHPRKRVPTGGVPLLLLCSIGALLGCHSPFINASVENRTGGTVSPVEIDYPSASFGTESLPAGAIFRYRFKVLGSGGTKLLWTDQKHVEHTVSGPSLREGQEGSLQIVLGTNGVVWTPSLRP